MTGKPEVILVSPDQLRVIIREELAAVSKREGEAEDRLTPSEVARMVRIRTATVYGALNSGALPAERRRDRWLIRRQSASDWARQLKEHQA